MKEMIKKIIIQLLLRLYMVATRSTVVVILMHAFYNQHNYLYVFGACLSLPLVFVALWRLIETLSLLANIIPNIEKIKQSIIKEENKNYKSKL